MKEEKVGWGCFFQWLRSRGLDSEELIVGEKCLGILEAVGEVFTEAKYQRCTVCFYRNVLAVTSCSKVKLVAKMLKVIQAQESKRAAPKRLGSDKETSFHEIEGGRKKAENGVEETLTYCDFPREHWTHIRTNNVIERRTGRSAAAPIWLAASRTAT